MKTLAVMSTPTINFKKLVVENPEKFSRKQQSLQKEFEKVFYAKSSLDKKGRSWNEIFESMDMDIKLQPAKDNRKKLYAVVDSESNEAAGGLSIATYSYAKKPKETDFVDLCSYLDCMAKESIVKNLIGVASLMFFLFVPAFLSKNNPSTKEVAKNVVKTEIRTNPLKPLAKDTVLLTQKVLK